MSSFWTMKLAGFSFCAVIRAFGKGGVRPAATPAPAAVEEPVDGTVTFPHRATRADIMHVEGFR